MVIAGINPGMLPWLTVICCVVPLFPNTRPCRRWCLGELRQAARRQDSTRSGTIAVTLDLERQRIVTFLQCNGLGYSFQVDALIAENTTKTSFGTGCFPPRK